MPGPNPTHFFIWPAGQGAAAQTYLDAANAAIEIIDPTADEWYPSGWMDIYDQPVVAKLGPPWRWNDEVLEEPTSCVGLHSGAVEHTNWVREPPEDEA